MRCITGQRLTMTAEVLRNGAEGDDNVSLDEAGMWKTQQDEITGEIVRVWVPLVASDNPLTVVTINCMVRPIVDGGIRVAGTTERFGKEYENVDFVQMHFPTNIIISKRDRITNIRDKKTKEILWKEEEMDKVGGDYRATVFNVNGVNQMFDPFGRMTHQFALLSRARAS